MCTTIQLKTIKNRNLFKNNNNPPCHRKYRPHFSLNNAFDAFIKTDNTTPSLTGSLSNKLEELKFRISSMHPKPHLVALTEIKHKNKWNIDISELQLDGYIIYCNNLQENGRGIVNYVRSDLVCRQYIPQTPFTESLLLELQLQNNFKVIVGTIYRSPNSRPDNDNDLLTFINNFSSSVYDSMITNYF